MKRDPAKRQDSRYADAYGAKKRATPAGGCSPIAVKTVSKRYKRRGSICAISYGTKKWATPTGKLLALQAVCSPIAVILVSKQRKTARLILRNFLWYKKFPNRGFSPPFGNFQHVRKIIPEPVQRYRLPKPGYLPFLRASRR